MAEIWVWFINDLVIFQSVYKRLKKSKKERRFFFAWCYFWYRFNKSWPKIKTFHARERPRFQGNFYLQIKNPPTSENTTVDNLFRWLSYGKKVEIKRRPRSFAPARFSLTITLNLFNEISLLKSLITCCWFTPSL